jgi:uncharacterized protein
MPITAFYASLLTFLFIALSVRIIRQREALKLPSGDGGHSDLLYKIRSHANFAEYVPLALVLMALAENFRTSIYLLHVAGIVLLIGRLSHAYGLAQKPEPLQFRIIGMMSTFTALGLLAILCLISAVQAGLWR